MNEEERKELARAWWQKYHQAIDDSYERLSSLGILGTIHAHTQWSQVAEMLAENNGPYAGPRPDEAGRPEEECKTCFCYGILCWVDKDTAAAVNEFIDTIPGESDEDGEMQDLLEVALHLLGGK